MVEKDLELQKIYDRVVNNPAKESFVIKTFDMDKNNYLKS